MAKKRAARPEMCSLEATMHLFGAAEFPTSTHFRDHIMKAVIAAENSDANIDSDHARDVIEGLVMAYQGALLGEIEQREENGLAADEDNVAGVPFTKAEELFLEAYRAAYGAELGQPTEEVECAMWPDCLPSKIAWPRALIIDVGRLLGFKDGKETKGWYKYVAEHREELGVHS